jgi:CubicO group peptidase (beta-lactamase class C family)
MAMGYDAIPFKQAPDPDDTTEMGWAAPAGGMYSTPNDMGRFIKYVLLSCIFFGCFFFVCLENYF